MVLSNESEISVFEAKGNKMAATRDAQAAFEDAIRAGVLSDHPDAPNYAGDYMYMYTEGESDGFKRRDTRQYVWS